MLASEVPSIRFGGLVEVLDAPHVAHAESGGWDLEQHVTAAAVVLLTKSDIAPPEELARTLECVLAASPRTTVLDAPHGAVDPALFFDAAEHTVPEGAQLPLWETGEAPREHGHHGHEHHVHHRAVSLDVPAPVDPATITDLLEDPPASVHRVKALVDVLTPSGLRRFAAHSVAGYVTVARTSRPAQAPPHSVVAAIGPEDTASSPVGLDVLAATERAEVPSSRELRRLTRYLCADPGDRHTSEPARSRRTHAVASPTPAAEVPQLATADRSRPSGTVPADVVRPGSRTARPSGWAR